MKSKCAVILNVTKQKEKCFLFKQRCTFQFNFADFFPLKTATKERDYNTIYRFLEIAILSGKEKKDPMSRYYSFFFLLLSFLETGGDIGLIAFLLSFISSSFAIFPREKKAIRKSFFESPFSEQEN